MASTFSYAQAAKGISTPAATSKPASGSATPAKEPTTAPTPVSIASVRSWADDAESESLPEQPAITRESRPQRSSSKPASRVSHSVDTASVSSPDLGASSSSTVTKDDDVSSIPNTSSESTWDNKSQASTSVDKSIEPVEKTSDKVKKGKNAVVKPLQEAPVPAVNIWKQRADELKAKVHKATPPPTTNGVSQGQTGPSVKKSDSGAQEKTTPGDSRSRGRDEISQGRKDVKADIDAKKGVKGKFPDKEAKSTPSALPPPPNRDQESWPTPELAVDEDRKKAQEKGDKVEKERKEGAPAATHGKHEWVKVPYTPSVVFNTPLPNAANARRGGKPGGRGGAQTGGRPTGFGSNGAEKSEKDGSVSEAVPNGEQVKRERPEGTTPRESSPSKSKRTGSAASPTLKDQVPAVIGEAAAKTAGPGSSNAEAQPRRASMSSQTPGQSNAYPRQYPSRPHKARRGDFSGTGERRRDGAVSPTKDNTLDDRRVPAATQTDTQGDGERRAPNFQDGPNSHHSKQGRYGSFTGGRERGRGGGRGARASYSNGHQFANGHVPSMQSSTFTLGPRSPISFNPENNNYFSAPQSKYGRTSHRSQSVATEPYRFPSYQGGPQVSPLQTYGMYEYGMMQPMSPVAYAPYVDQYALFSMITTQVEYYFSVDNLLKDMYLRRHMDSQGFVSLEFIAGFNRIKHLSADLELIKLVCQQSHVIEYRTSEDGQDRLRRRDGWDQWVLDMAERDTSAQNEGPKELHRPPIPHPAGFDQPNPPQWQAMSTGMPTGVYGNESSYTQMNGYHGVSQDAATAAPENLPSGTTLEGRNGDAVPNGHSTESSTAVSGDSFSDAQVESLTVIVRKQAQSKLPVLPHFASRTFSNGSIDSKHDVLDEPEKTVDCQLGVTDTGSLDDSVYNDIEEHPESVTKFPRSTCPAPVRLYWVKDQDAPVHSIPFDSSHESYYHLRSKALQQRQISALGITPYDMEVLYQFWSHFLIRNFNTRMYDEFRHFAFEDAAHRTTDVGLSNLIKFYGESLLSSQSVIRERVASDFVDLVKAEDEHRRPAFRQLQSAFRNGAINLRSRKRIDGLLDGDLLASLES